MEIAVFKMKLMEALLLTKFQIEKLVDFCFDIAKGVLLASLGFTAITPTALIIRTLFFTSGLIIAISFLYIGLWLGKEIRE